MKINLMSDLHLEFADYKVDNVTKSDVLILAGDIVCVELFKEPMAVAYHNFFESVSDQYSTVLYVMGNHEFYGGEWDSTPTILREELSPYTNIHLLENQTHQIGDVTFFGSTLWTDMDNANPVTMNVCRKVMNDFRKIKNLSRNSKVSPMDTVHRHRHSLKAMSDALVRSDQSFVISHHAPSFKSVHQRYFHDGPVNNAYYSDLDKTIMDLQPVAWVHGHTHTCFDYNIGNTRVVCNPRGYRNENLHFDPHYTLEIVQ